jgi:DNA-binding transcriptional regulator LsrR (DeoR family)
LYGTTGTEMDIEEELMLKAAWLYFLERITQQQISELLGISRMKVIRLLEKAKQAGVIKISMREDNVHRMALERHIIETYKLKDAFIIPTPQGAAISEINDAISDAAAMYIDSRIKADTFINIGYGDTMGKTLNNLAKNVKNTISCISLTGGVSIYLPNARSSIFNARLFLIPAPLLVSSKEMVLAITAEHHVQEIVRMVSLSSFTVIGIGGMNDEATVLKTGVLSKNDFLYLKMQGAVGDILCHFFDSQGNMVANPLEERLVTTPLSTLKSLSNVTGVAAGKYKREAIKGALALGYIDILVTDEDTAQWLIDNKAD